MFANLNDGNISISCIRGDGEEHISIYIEDGKTRYRLMEVNVDLKEFAQALTGRGQVNCKIGLPLYIREAIDKEI